MESRFGEGLSSSLKLRRRSDVDIMANILDEAREGARKTRLMYRGNMSYRQLHVYLKLLLGLELLALHSNLYKTTVKGLKFLDAYRTLKALMNFRILRLEYCLSQITASTLTLSAALLSNGIACRLSFSLAGATVKARGMSDSPSQAK